MGLDLYLGVTRGPRKERTSCPLPDMLPTDAVVRVVGGNGGALHACLARYQRELIIAGGEHDWIDEHVARVREYIDANPLAEWSFG